MVQNLDRWKRRLAAIPGSIKQAAEDQLKVNAEQMVSYLKVAAPSGADESPSSRRTAEGAKRAEDYGKIREAIHTYPSDKRELTMVIVCDAKDDKGHNFAQHLEYGHRTPDGKSVPAHPFWWPTYRAYKKKMRQQMMKATREAVKRSMNGQGG